MSCLLPSDATEFNLPRVGANFSGKSEFSKNEIQKHPYRRDPSLLFVMNQFVFDQGGVAAMLRSYKNERPQRNGREAFWNQVRGNDHWQTADQITSTNRATSPWHSEHEPTSNKSPLLTAPVKLLIVTSWRHFPHQTFDSNCFLVSAGIAAHSVAAGSVNLGIDSMLMGSSLV